MIEELTTPLFKIIGSSIVAALSCLLIIINKKISNWILDNIWSKLSINYKFGKLKKCQIEKDAKIREILIELRTLVNADRTCLFQFHNGNVFTTKNPIWKISNTHESVSPGISSEIRNLQDIKASSIIETINSLWNDVFPIGVSNISASNRRVIFIDVEKLEDSYSKCLLVEQGIEYVIDVPIYNNENICVGFVAVNYCENKNVEEIKSKVDIICKHASQVQFILLG